MANEDQRTAWPHVVLHLGWELTRLGRWAVIAGAIALLARHTSDAIVAMAGKDTFAQVLLDLRADGAVAVGVSQSTLDTIVSACEGMIPSEPVFWTLAAALTTAGVGITYGLSERELRKRAVAKLTTQTEILEQHIHPGRTSSQLTRRGDTPEGY